MKKKRIIIILVLILVGLLLGGYYFFTKEDKKTTLNLIEKQWIDKNKNSVMDFGIVNDIPIFNYNGVGLFFDFLDNLEEVTGLVFNRVPFQYNEKTDIDYMFKIVDNAKKNDILIYQDNYAIITNFKQKFIDVSEVKGLTLGVLADDLEKVNTYLKGSVGNVLKSYDEIDTMFQDLISSEVESLEIETEEVVESNPIDAVVLPKTLFLDKIIDNEELHISYIITEMSKDYIIELGKNEKLNNILIKYYDKWLLDYETSYNKHLNNFYFDLKKINEKDVVNFRSNRYKYGFVENAPYDIIINKKLLGYNSTFLREFSKLPNIEIIYESHSSNKSILDAFNSNKLDLMLEIDSKNDYKMDVYKTIPLYNNKLVVISDISNNLTINSLNSLSNQEIMTISNSEIVNYLKKYQLKIKGYDNLLKLVKNIKKDSIIVIDKEMFNFYNSTDLKKYKIYYEEDFPNDYRLVIRETKKNKIFANYLDFYLSFINNQEIINEGYYNLFNVDEKVNNIRKVILGVISLIIVGIGFLFRNIVIKKKDSKKIIKKISKENKIKYIDQLTSLKNRAYLSDNLELWDNSEIYPQAIVIVDLNNISYINDNYGHAEGDKVIKEAANILILNQVENSDIIRTSGNEFLIYMVGHDEKSVISYIRKLNKEFKNLVHNFGAAIGYSTIIDGIKTIDDAINEATLDMRDNKETTEKQND